MVFDCDVFHQSPIDLSSIGGLVVKLAVAKQPFTGQLSFG
jgi:hypothetical protein